MKRAHRSVFGDRALAFALGLIEDFCTLLPEVLQSLGDVLVEMRGILVDAYQSFEEAFDGSKVLPIFPELRSRLQLLVERAHGLDVTLPATPQILNEEDMKQLDEIKGQGDQDQKEDQKEEDQEEGSGVGRQSMDPVNPFLSKEEGGSFTLRKRPLVGSPPKAGSAFQRKRFKEGSV